MFQNRLLRGAFLLLLANTLARFLGFVYRVLLVRIMGAEGIGLTEILMPLYSFCLVIAGWGVPLAMSRFLAQENCGGTSRRGVLIWRTGIGILTFSGLCISVIAFLAAPFLTKYFTADDRVLLSFQVLVPAIFIVAVASGYRGFFQGVKEIAVIGASQNVEQLLRVGVGLALASFLLPYGLVYAIAGVAAASLVGETGGLLYIMAQKRRYPKAKLCYPTPQVDPYCSRHSMSRELLAFGTPVTMQRLLASFLMMLQALLIPKCLQMSGLTVPLATEIYGRFAGVAMSLLHLPGVFTGTMGTALLPVIAEATPSSPLLARRINLSLTYTGIISLPVMLLLYFYGEFLCGLLFHCPEAGAPLKILALGAIFFYLQPVLVSILQGLGQVKILLLNLFLSGICLLGGIILLTPLPGLGIQGAALASVICAMVNCILNLYYIRRYTGLKIQWRQFLGKPVFACLAPFGLFLTQPISGAAAPYLTMLAAAALYFIGLWLVRGLPKKPV